MGGIPARVAERLSEQVKRFQKAIAEAQNRGDAEADTANLVRRMLCDLFGYEDNKEVTGEFLIKGHYCDLAIKNADSGKVRALVEVKSICTTLSPTHLSQAVGYASGHGVEWVVLTNASAWRVYKVTLAKCVEEELVVEIDFPSLGPKNQNDLELLYLFCQEGWAREALDDYDAEREALSGFVLSAVIMREPIIKAIRRDLRKVFPDVKATVEQIRSAIETAVLRREVADGDKFVEAQKLISKRIKKYETANRSPATDESEAQASQ